MEEFFRLRVEQQILRHKLQVEKRELHKKFYKEHRGWFWFLDVLIVLGLLFNLGAIGITNALVMKANPEKVMEEATPVQAKLNNFETSTKAQNSFFPIMIHMLFLAWLLGYYVVWRNKVKNWQELNGLIIFAIAFSYMLGYDFTNDLGYWIGKKLWGA